MRAIGWLILLRFVWTVDHWLNIHPKIRSPGTRQQTVFSLLGTQTSQRSTDCSSLLPHNTNCIKNISVTQTMAQAKINHHCPDKALRENRENKPRGTVTTVKGWWTQWYLEPIPCSVITTKAVPSLSAAHTQPALMQGLFCCKWSRPGWSSKPLQLQRQVWEQRDNFQYFLAKATEPLRHLRSSRRSSSISSYLLYRTKTDRQM